MIRRYLARRRALAKQRWAVRRVRAMPLGLHLLALMKRRVRRVRLRETHDDAPWAAPRRHD